MLVSAAKAHKFHLGLKSVDMASDMSTFTKEFSEDLWQGLESNSHMLNLI